MTERERASSEPTDVLLIRRAVWRLILLSAGSLVALTLVTLPLAGLIARSLALADAAARTLSFARTVAGPLLDDAARKDPGRSALVTALDFRLRDGSIMHAAIYDPDGTVVWSADPSTIGRVEKLDPEVQALFQSLGSISEYSRFTHAKDDDSASVAVLEVYAGALDPQGRPFLLEWYWPTSQLAADERQILTRLLPLTAGSLLAFQLIVLGLTLWIGRRVERDRLRLTNHALRVAKIERRRLSEDLHDGVVQDLSGIGYALPTISRDLRDGSAGSTMLVDIGRVIQQDVVALRALIADIRPIDLRGSGLREDLEGQSARATEQGVETHLTFEGNVDDLTPIARGLVHRIVREGLRNVIRHSGASRAWVNVWHEHGLVSVRVEDDGEGLSDAPSRDLRTTKGKHFGLDLLRESVSEIDGTVELRSGATGGAELLVTFRQDRLRF